MNAYRGLIGICTTILLIALLATSVVKNKKPNRPAPASLQAPFTREEATATQRAWADYLGTPVEQVLDLGNGVRMDFVLVPPGRFVIGASDSERQDKSAYDSEFPEHEVTIREPLYVSKFATTKAQFRQFVTATNYQTEAERTGKGWGLNQKTGRTKESSYSWQNTGFPQADDHPVVVVSWYDGKRFCDWLSYRFRQLPGPNEARLLRDAEWEYCCRAGTTTRTYAGDDPKEVIKIANVADATLTAQFPNILDAFKALDGYVFTAPGGQFQANAFGLHDMIGNVWQWCDDSWNPSYTNESQIDPVGGRVGAKRSVRGGSFLCGPRACRAAARDGIDPTTRVSDLGFRVALCLSVQPTSGKTPPRPSPSDDADAPTLATELLRFGYHQIPLLCEEGRVSVHVRVNGLPQLFDVDTGSPVSFLDWTTALAMNLVLNDVDALESPFGGRYKTAIAQNVSLQLGAIDVIPPMGIRVADLEHLNSFHHQTGSQECHGLIGRDILKAFLAVIDFDNQRLFLLPSEKRSFLFEGNWQCVARKSTGGVAEGAFLLGDLLSITDTTMRVYQGGESHACSYEWNIGSAPASLELVRVDGKSAKTRQFVLTRFDRDHLSLCLVNPGNTRPPSDFSSDSPGTLLVEYRRIPMPADNERVPSFSSLRRAANEFLKPQGYREVQIVGGADGDPEVEVTVNNRKCMMILDTGAGDLLIEPSFADELKLDTNDGPVRGHMGGTVNSRIGKIKSLRLGGLERRNSITNVVRPWIFDQEPIDAKSPRGLLGTDQLAAFGSIIDFYESKLYVCPVEKSYRNRLQGEWRCVQSETAGVAITHERASGIRASAHRDVLSLSDGEETTTYQYEIKSSEDSAEYCLIDLADAKIGAADRKMLGILTISSNGNTLNLAMSPPNDSSRPKDFVTKGTKRSVMVFTRDRRKR
jgi:uncharacterized protein (TIGR03067 family)